jgi:hypothetical protein
VRPDAGSSQPLQIIFQRPLDWALLPRTVSIVMGGGHAVEGRPLIDDGEKRFGFIPTFPWAQGQYEVRIASSLEDVCGNSVTGAFDKAERSEADMENAAATQSIAFALA